MPRLRVPDYACARPRVATESVTFGYGAMIDRYAAVSSRGVHRVVAIVIRAKRYRCGARRCEWPRAVHEGGRFMHLQILRSGMSVAMIVAVTGTAIAARASEEPDADERTIEDYELRA